MYYLYAESPAFKELHFSKQPIPFLILRDISNNQTSYINIQETFKLFYQFRKSNGSSQNRKTYNYFQLLYHHIKKNYRIHPVGFLITEHIFGKIRYLLLFLLLNKKACTFQVVSLVIQGRISDIHQCDTMFVQWLMAKNNKIMSMFVLFSSIFSHFESLASFRNWGTNLAPKQSNRMSFVHFSKVQQLI